MVDRGGYGHEIVRELKVCPTCADQLDEAEIPEKPIVDRYDDDDDDEEYEQPRGRRKRDDDDD